MLAAVRAAPVRLAGVVVALGAAFAILAGTALNALSPLHAVVLAVLALAGLVGSHVTASLPDLVDSRPGRRLVAVVAPRPDDESPRGDGPGDADRGEEPTSPD